MTGYVIAVALVAILFYVAVLRWQIPYIALFFYLAISSYLTAKVLKPEVGNAVRDIFFVAPSYLGFLRSTRKRVRFYGIPKEFAVSLLVFCAVVLLEGLNPFGASASLLVRLAALRNWILFAPILYLTYALLLEPRHIVLLFRILLTSTWLPILIGFYQGLFHSASPIVSTFATPEEYRNFAILTIIVSYTLFATDTHRIWRSVALLTTTAAVTALLLSGQHQVLYTCIVVILMLTSFHRSSSVPAATVVAICGTAGLLLSLRAEHTLDGALSFYEILLRSPFGMGTGSSEIGAWTVESASLAARAPMSYFSQAAWELGLFGVIMSISLFVLPYSTAMSAYGAFRSPELRAALGGCMAYLSYCLAGCATHHFFTLDSNQLFFWVFCGILFRLNAMRTPYRSTIRSSHSQHLNRAAEAEAAAAATVTR